MLPNFDSAQLDQLKQISFFINALVKLFALLVGGFWSYWLFVLKRTRHQKVRFSHQIVHVSLTDEINLLTVFIQVSNIGEVLLCLKTGEISIQRILPQNYGLLAMLNEGYNINEYFKQLVGQESGAFDTEIAWPVLYKLTRDLKGESRQIEPGGNELIQFDFLIPKKIKKIRIYSFFENSTKRPSMPGWIRMQFLGRLKTGKKRRVGWDWATFYDLSK